MSQVNALIYRSVVQD